MVQDGVAAGNAEYAENEIPQSGPKTVSIFASNQPLQQQEPHDPSLSFTGPPHVPESFPRDPVPQGGKGEGWPYAPQGWPKPDDKWGWRVGQRASASSLWIDRYVTLPASLTKGRKPSSDEQFASKSRLVEYLRQKFPLMKDPNSIFKAFDWKIPAPKNFEAPEKPEKRGSTVKRDKPSPMDGDEYWQKLKKQCPAGIRHCPLSKAKDYESESLRRLTCQICCSEPGFCRECKCILCCNFFAPDAEDYSIIRCLNSPLSEQGICGHAAHLECALNSQLAGVIKKNGLHLEYICRRCDRKTYLIETVSRLVSAFMSTTVTESVETSLQLLLRVVQDPDDEARSSGKIHDTLVGAIAKVREGADIVKSCKELTEQLFEILELQSGRSRANRRKRTPEDSLHPDETSGHKRALQYNSVGSPDAPATFSTSEFQENNNSTPAINTGPGCSNDTSPAVHTINSIIVSEGGCEADGVTTTSGTRVRPDLNMDKQLPRTSLQNPPKPEDIVWSIATPQTPSELVSCTPLLSSLLDQSVCIPPTLSIEEHIRQCEAMTDRVKGAGQLNSSSSIFSDSKSPSPTAGCFTVEYRENQVVNPVSEASDDTGSPSVEELITSIPSSSRPKGPSLFNSQDADEDHLANTEIIEVRKSSRMRPTTRSSSRREKSPRLSSAQDVGGYATASTKIIDVSKSARIKPPMSSSRDKSLSLANSQDGDEDDVMITQIVEVPKNVEPLQTTPSLDAALETTHVAGLEAEFEDQISEALEKLKRAQAAEYACAEESLNAQKKIVIEKYRQLGKVCGEFAKKENVHLLPYQFRKDQRQKPRAELDRAMNCLMVQHGEAQEGQKVFESMLAISNGFGQVSKEFLREFFKWSASDITEA